MNKLLLIYIIFFSSCMLNTNKKSIIKDSYKLVWFEDFKSKNLDTTKWNIELRKPGWVNNELQEYTNKSSNIYIQNNNLIIEAIKEKHKKNYYTSGRLNTSGKFNLKYGRIEIKAKIPKIKGTWPAFWLLSETISEEGWPKCGEIDIMEHINEEDLIYGTIHTEAYNHMNKNQIGSSIKIENLDKKFNVFGFEWNKENLVWFINGKEYFRVKKEDYFKDDWPFDKNYFLIVNQAVGGFWPGNPNSNFDSSKLIVDWIKVYN